MNIDKLLTRRRGRAQENSFDHNRVEYFQTMSNMLVSSRVDVAASEDIPTAACKWDADRNTHQLLLRDGKVPVSSDVVSKIGKEERFVSLLCKEGMVYHEQGHVLFTDHDAWKDVLSQVGLMERENLQRLLNVMEDAVIEAFLIEHFGVDRILALKNENKHKTIGVFQNGDRDDPTLVEPYFEDPIHPVSLATMVFEEFGRYDIGIVKRHLDPNEYERFNLTPSASQAIDMTATDIIEETLACLREVSQEPDARKRYERVAELFKQIYPKTASQQGQKIDVQNISPDAEQTPSGSEQQMSQFRIKTPDIEEEEESDSESESGGSGDGDSQEEEEESGEGSDSSEAGESDADSDKAGANADSEDSDETAESGSEGAPGEPDGTGQESGSGGDEDTVNAPDMAQGEVESNDEEEIDQQSGVVDDDEKDAGQTLTQQAGGGLDEDEIKAAFKSAGASSEKLQVRNPNDVEVNVDGKRAAEAQRIARSIESVVDDYLHQRERTRESKNELWGQFDDSNLVDAERGSPRSFRREDKPDELDYHAVIMCDESSSMAGSDMRAAATGLSALVKGFEDAGIDVDVYRFGRTPALIKTAAEEYEDVEDMMLDKTTRGSTRLYPLLQELEGRTDLESKHAFGLVLTDGLPNNKETCKDLLGDIDIPMLSIQVSQETDYFNDVYDALENVDSSDEISGALRKIVRQAIFK